MKILHPERLTALGATGTTIGGIATYMSLANVALSMLATLCSLIVSAYGLYCIYEKRKAKRAAALKCDQCPDRKK